MTTFEIPAAPPEEPVRGPWPWLARAADRAIPTLLVLLLVTLTASISAANIVTGALYAATLLALRDPATRARYRLPLILPMAAFTVVTLLSAAFAADWGTAFFESKHLAALPLFFVAANGFRSGAGIRRALGWFLGAVALASLYAILQALACGTGVELADWVGWALRVKLDACRAVHPFRAKGYFSIYMTLGGSLVIALALALALQARARRRAGWLLAPTVLGFVALSLTYARNAWLGLAVAIVLLTVLTRRLRLVVPVVLAVVIALAVPSALKTRMLSMLDPTDETARERLYLWDAGRRMIAAAPLLGHGPGGVRLYYPEYRNPEGKKARTGHLHNNVVQIAAERGLLGLAAWLWIWIAFFTGAARIYRALPTARADDRALVAGSVAAVAGFLVAGLFEYNFGDSEVIDLLWVVMASPFACAAGSRPDAANPGAS